MKPFLRLLAGALALWMALPRAAQAEPPRFSYRPVAELASHAEPVRAIAFSLDGRLMLSGGDDGVLFVYHPGESTPVQQIATRHGRVLDVAVAPGGRQAATTGTDGWVRVWDLATRTLVRELKAHDDPVNSVAYDVSGERLVTASDDETIRLWDVGSGLRIGELKGHDEAVFSALFLPSGCGILSSSADKSLRMWDVVTRKETRNQTETAAKYGKMRKAALGPDARVIASAVQEVKRSGRGLRALRQGGIIEDDFIQLRDGVTSEDLGRLEGHLEVITGLSFAPDGRYLASSSEDHSWIVWDLAKREKVTAVELPDKVYAVAFSPDGRWLAAGCEDHKIYLYAVGGVYSVPIQVVGSGRYNPPRIDLAPAAGAPLAAALVGIAAMGDVDGEVATILGDTIRAVLVKTNRFELIDRENTKRILDEQRFQFSGAVAPDSAVVLGRLLGAKALLSGTLSRLGDAYAVSLSLSRVETGAILASIQEQARCDKEDLFLLAATAARRLAAEAEKTPPLQSPLTTPLSGSAEPH